MNPRLRNFLFAFAILAVDFASKRYVLAHREQFSGGIPLIPDILSFTYVRNAGAAFGMFQGGRWPFIAVSVAAALWLSWELARGHCRGLRAYSFSMILAGALGNLIDRIFYDGRVVDFILMSWKSHHFPVYNVADMGVSIGATFLILSMLRDDRRKKSAPDSEPDLVAANDAALGAAASPSVAGRDEPEP